MIVNSKYDRYLDFQLDMKVFQSVILNSQVDLESYKEEILRELQQEAPIKSFDTIRYQLSDLVSADYVIEYNNELEVPEDELLLDFDEIGGSEEYDIVDELDDGFDEVEDIKSRCVINYDYSPLSIDQVNEINEAYSKFLDSDLEEFTGNIAELEEEIEKSKQRGTEDEEINDTLDEEEEVLVSLEEEVIDFSGEDSEDAEYDIEDELSGESSTYEEYDTEDDEEYEGFDSESEDSDSESEGFDSESEDFDSEGYTEEEYDFDEDEDEDYYTDEEGEEEYEDFEEEDYYSEEDEEAEEEYEEEYEDDDTDEDIEYAENNNEIEEVTNSTEEHIADDGKDDLFEPEFDNIEINEVVKNVTSEKVKEEPKEETPKIKEDEPKDLIQFIRKHPRCEVSFALQYFSKKEIEKNIMMGRIIKKGNKLYF